MSEQDKDKRTKKSPRISKNKDGQQASKMGSAEVASPTKDESVTEQKGESTLQTVETKSSRIIPDKTTISDNTDLLANAVKEDVIQNESDKIDSDIKNDNNDDDSEVPTLSGWLASGFSSIVKTAKDTVNKSGTLESIKRDLVELKATVQSTSASSVLNSTASIVKNTLNEIGATVNEISSLGTSLPDDDENNDASMKRVDEKAPNKKKDSIAKTPSVSESPSLSSEEHSLFNFSTLNSFAHKFGESARSTLTAVKDVVVDSLALKNDNIDELEEDAFVIHNGVILPLPEFRPRLKQLQVDGRTFLKEPEGDPELFEHWLSSFSLIDYEKQMEHLISSVPELASIRETLVPAQLSDNDFWHRYYYKAHQLKEKLKQEAIERFERDGAQSSSPKPKDHGDVGRAPSKPASVASSVDSTAQLSRSSTDDWDKVDNVRTSDDEKDWVKCD